MKNFLYNLCGLIALALLSLEPETFGVNFLRIIAVVFFGGLWVIYALKKDYFVELFKDSKHE